MAKQTGTTDAPAADAAGQVATTGADQPATNAAADEQPATGAAEEAGESVEVTINAEGADVSSLFTSFVEAQNHFATPRRSKTAEVKNDAGKLVYSYKYADLDEIVKAIRPALKAHKLGFYQLVTTEGAKVTVRTVLLHGPTGAKLESDPLVLMAQSVKAQHIGGAITYARRYSLASFVGVAAEDDSDAMEQMNTEGRRQVHVPEDSQIPSGQGSRNTASKAPQTTKAAPAAGGKATERKKIGKGDAAHYDGCVTVKQIKRMFGIAEDAGVSVEKLADFLRSGGIAKSEDIPVDRYDGIIAAIQAGHVN